MHEPFSILSTKVLDGEVREKILSLGWTLREEAFIETQSLMHLLSKRGVCSPEWKEYRDKFAHAIRGIEAQTIVIFTSENALLHFPWDYVSPPSMNFPGNMVFPDAENNWFSNITGKGDVLPPHHPYLWNVACLSGKTFEAVTDKLREEQVVCTAGNGRDLAMAIAADGRFKKALFFCAEEHRPELPAILREAGMFVEEIPVYRTAGQPKTIDTPFDAVLFFSPSAVDQFFQLNSLPHGTVCFAIGETTAEAIKDYTDERVIASPIPNQEELLGCVRFYYDNQQCYE